MNKLEKYLAKSGEKINRKETTVLIDGDEWRVRQLTLLELRQCEAQADKGDKFDWYRYNDARIVKATEHDFPWNDPDLLQAYKAGDKYELPAKLFNHNPVAYSVLLDAVRRVNGGVSEGEVVDELKNSSEPTEKQATSVGHS